MDSANISIGNIIGPILGGYLVDKYGFQTACIYLSVLLAIISLIVLVNFIKNY